MKKLILMIMGVMIMACAACTAGSPVPSKDAPQNTTKETNMSTEKKWTEPTKVDVDGSKKYTAVITTSKGVIECELFAKEAPLSVTNFNYLARGGFYDGLTFHRVEKGFVVQGGDPLGTGTGGPGYTIPAEIKKPHLKGALAWARTGDEVNPQRRSSGSQFYITLAPTPFLDGGYTVFGQTTKGMDVVEKIQRGDKIEGVTIRVE